MSTGRNNRFVIFQFGVVVGLSNLERTEQNRANEHEYGAHSQHIQAQG
jgi:hypothetical protein